MYKDIVIVQAVRIPFERYCGSVGEIDYFGLGALPMREILTRTNLSGTEIEEVYWGVGHTSVCTDVYTPVAARHLWGQDHHCGNRTVSSDRGSPLPRRDLALPLRGRAQTRSFIGL